MITSGEQRTWAAIRVAEETPTFSFNDYTIQVDGLPFARVINRTGWLQRRIPHSSPPRHGDHHYVLSGKLEHKDSLGRLGDSPRRRQRMTAGRGIRTARRIVIAVDRASAADLDTSPTKPGHDPGYEQKELPKREAREASPHRIERTALKVRKDSIQDAKLFSPLFGSRRRGQSSRSMPSVTHGFRWPRVKSS